MNNDMYIPIAIDLSYLASGVKKYFLSLHAQGEEDSREIVFKYIWQKERRPKVFYDSESKEDLDIHNIDHFTIHKDGTVLESFYLAKKIKKHMPSYKLPHTLSQTPDYCFTPLLIFSIKNIDLHSRYVAGLEPPDLKITEADITWNSDNRPFSAVIFVISNKLNENIINFHYPKIFEQTATLPNAVNRSTGLLIAYSKRLIIRKGTRYSDYISPKVKKSASFTYIDIPYLMTITPSNTTILNMMLPEEIPHSIM